ncbi:hypothetical protein KL86PLE_110036 [uncultured Pleomorphomonas sp.]|uniref:Uncharacterized protein n=1 Tax=uncultured Pleomorphomonas sp. TaxID=442121 RepID=A0A212L756_9HYPH|nr:hypothetical protein KL86PLE_110036 [uncultured Pleomorphomonas sp.]
MRIYIIKLCMRLNHINVVLPDVKITKRPTCRPK